MMFTTNRQKVSIRKVRFCVPKINHCELGTYLPYYDESDELQQQFVCLKCDVEKHKVVTLNKFIPSIPFDVEEDVGTFHQNIQSPHFVCGDVASVIGNCEYYMDYASKEDAYGTFLFLRLISGSSVTLNHASTYCARCKKGYQGDFVETSDTGDNDSKLLNLFYHGYSSCDVPIINCEYFKKPFGLGYLPIKHRVADTTTP